MKNKIYLLFALLCASMMTWATDYCHTEMSAGGKTIYLTCQEVSTGNYQLKVECNEAMSGLGGSFCEVNGVGGYQLNAAGHFTLSADGKTITCDIESSLMQLVRINLFLLITSIAVLINLLEQESFSEVIMQPIGYSQMIKLTLILLQPLLVLFQQVSMAITFALIKREADSLKSVILILLM